MKHFNKIYYVANARMPNEKAHGIQIAKMCEEFVESGYNLELIVPNRRTEHNVSMKDFYDLREDINTIKLPIIDRYNSGFFGFVLSSITFMCSYTVYLLWKRITSPGIIYTVDMDSFSSTALPFLGMSVFIEMHSPKRRTLVTRILFHFVNGIIATNSLIKEDIKTTFKIRDDKFLVEPNGIDSKQFLVPESKKKSRETIGLPLDKNIIVYIGRFYGWKGLEIIPKTAECLPDDVLIYMVGGTSMELEGIISSKNIPKNVIFAGPRDYNEIPTWLSAADALLVLGTSKNQESYRYTSPMKIFEYMISGRIIIASNTPAIREVLSEKESILYEPDDFNDLKNKILNINFDSSETKSIIKQARIKADYYSWSNRVERIGSFVQKITNV